MRKFHLYQLDDVAALECHGGILKADGYLLSQFRPLVLSLVFQLLLAVIEYQWFSP